jgi:hypothetical protein
MAPVRLMEEAAGAVAEHAAEAGHEAAHELPNLITLITHFMADGPVKEFLEHWEGMIFAYAIAGLVILIAHLASRNPKMIPGKLQNVVEMVVEGLSNFITGILGPDGKRYVPFLGSLFIYIYAMNVAGALPLGKSPTASPNTTVALALCVFVYVHYIGLTRNGPLGYVKAPGRQSAEPGGMGVRAHHVPHSHTRRNCAPGESLAATFWKRFRRRRAALRVLQSRRHRAQRVPFAGRNSVPGTVHFSRAVDELHPGARLHTAEHDLHSVVAASRASRR